MTDIIAIEFDCAKFDDVLDCEAWLKNHPELVLITENRNFKLRKVAASLFMSDEHRKVYAWHGNLARWANFTMYRPDPHVMIMKKSGDFMWHKEDLPPLSQATKQKRDLEERKEIAKHMRRKQRLQESAKKREAKAAEKTVGPKSTKLPKNPILVTDGVYGAIKKRKFIKKQKIKKEDVDSDFEELIVPDELLASVNAPLPPLDDGKPLSVVSDVK